MKAKKLLARLNAFMDADLRTQQEEMKSIRKVLKELKEKERKLQKKIEKPEAAEAREALQLQLDVIYAQRRKGLDRVREIKALIQEKKNKDA